jgi:hypothetical protein
LGWNDPDWCRIFPSLGLRQPCKGAQVDANDPNDASNSSGDKPSTDDASKRSVTRKKPYVAPAFRFERVFETNALTCGKVISTQGSCKFILKNS